jgi:hypothetical protein
VAARMAPYRQLVGVTTRTPASAAIQHGVRAAASSRALQFANRPSCRPLQYQ